VSFLWLNKGLISAQKDDFKDWEFVWNLGSEGPIHALMLHNQGNNNDSILLHHKLNSFEFSNLVPKQQK
jgi:hypothetical protein